ncbi:hypothetical protein C0V97_01970 [Asaia sp. W19]|uniref:DUF2125 domain-containing protein n=1 Tax=unclassified Asaia TaxID=2685023 RepID=UPI000F8DE6D1|nr:DUF2125 domain-containing protein [Asaia sp. W19]RUT27013.1 hypothetical protein C0V97_01970 [Asaia sp. W19]
MKNRLFYALLGITLLLLSAFGVDCLRMARLGRSLDQMRLSLAAAGWHLDWDQRSLARSPWGQSLTLSQPRLIDARGRGWGGKTLVLGVSFLHPASIRLEFGGPQIFKPSDTMTVTSSALEGHFVPASRTLILETRQMSLDMPPVSGIETLTLGHVTVQLTPDVTKDPPARGNKDITRSSPLPGGAVELSAESVSIKRSAQERNETLTPDIGPLLTTLPSASKLHLIIVALRDEAGRNASKTAYGRYLIQEASFQLGALSCIARGTLSGAGEGTLWAHLSGLQGFVRSWIALLPESGRITPDYAPLLKALDEQSARIPDHLDLPIPVGRDDILLQNHISAIITGHSR